MVKHLAYRLALVPLLWAAALACLPGCKQEGRTGEIRAADVVNNPATADSSAAVNPANRTEPAITWDHTSYDFGSITTGDKVHHRYTFRNSGQSPLIISHAKGSCGCTVPTWTNTPIAPGDTGSIFVVFDSEGKVGAQDKGITVTANTNPSQSQLTLNGFVRGLSEKK